MSTLKNISSNNYSSNLVLDSLLLHFMDRNCNTYSCTSFCDLVSFLISILITNPVQQLDLQAALKELYLFYSATSKMYDFMGKNTNSNRIEWSFLCICLKGFENRSQGKVFQFILRYLHERTSSNKDSLLFSFFFF